VDNESGEAGIAPQRLARHMRDKSGGARMTWALRIAAATLLILAGLAFHRWDLFHVDPGHPRYVHTHDWAGGPDILQLTAFVWLASAGVVCLLLGTRGGTAGGT